MEHFISAFDLNTTGFPNLSPPNAQRRRSASRRTSMGGRCAAPLLACTLFVSSSQVWSQESPAPLSNWSDADKESFLMRAEVVKMKKVHTGITGTKRATFSDGQHTHDASIQSVNVSKSSYATARGMEVNFRDSYKYNIAAYRLDRLLNLHMIPVSVERKVKGKRAAVTWWVDDVKMMEGERYRKKIAPPNRAKWNDQMFQVRIFNELVYNTDANLGNLLITNDWKLVMIDFSRGFRRHKDLMAPKNLLNCRLDRRFYDGMRELKEDGVNRLLGDMLTEREREGLMARKDKIVSHFDGLIAQKGENGVLCSLPGH